MWYVWCVCGITLDVLYDMTTYDTYLYIYDNEFPGKDHFNVKICVAIRPIMVLLPPSGCFVAVFLSDYGCFVIIAIKYAKKNFGVNKLFHCLYI